MGEQRAAAAASVRTATIRGVPVLRVAGEIDTATADVIRPELLVWLENAPDEVVVDLSGVRFLASGGLALLVEAARHGDRCGVRFVLAASHRAALRPIQATGLDQVFDIHPDAERAAAAVVALGARDA